MLPVSEEPTFSIIMPCYNSEAYVQNAVNSVLRQSYPCWELIAVNDGSTDRTLDILEQYAKEDSRIKVFSKENGGYVSAVNFGLEKISGDYFLIMGSDDALGENLLSALRDHAVPQRPDCIMWRTVLIQNGEPLGIESITDFTGEASAFDTALAAYSQMYPDHARILFTRDTSKCYKRALLGDLRYFGRYGFDADGIFSMLFCHRAHSFCAVPVDGYFWTLRDDSLSGRKTFLAQELDRIQNWILFYEQLSQLDAAEISQTEKEYLYYSFDILRGAWSASRPTYANYMLIRRAAGILRKMAKKADYPLSLSASAKLLLYFPALWKFYQAVPAPLRNAVHKLKQLIKR